VTPTSAVGAGLTNVGPVNAQPSGSTPSVAPRSTSGGPVPAGQRLRRRLALVIASALPILLGGCQLPRFWGYRGSTKQAHDEFLLYSGTVIAAIVVGGIVALLILWAVIAYRRRSDETPRQFQYHIPLEITYTVIPIVIVLVLFGFTVVTENRVDAVSPHPALDVKVTAFQWGWQFDYQGSDGLGLPPYDSAQPRSAFFVRSALSADNDPVGLDGKTCVQSASTADDCLGPGLVLPAGKEVTIRLVSRDVVHGFYVPAFNFSRYAQPGVENVFDFNVQHPGIYRAQCTQICGLYHSQMFFHVVVLPVDQFRAWVAASQLRALAQGGDADTVVPPAAGGSPVFPTPSTPAAPAAAPATSTPS